MCGTPLAIAGQAGNFTGCTTTAQASACSNVAGGIGDPRVAEALRTQPACVAVAAGPALFIGLAVFSHWILDFLVHRPDLPLLWDGPMVGLGLWNYPLPEQVLELGLLALAGAAWSCFFSESTSAERASI